MPILSTFFGCSDPFIAIIGTILTIFSFVIMAIGQKSWTGPNENWDPSWIMFLSAATQWNLMVNVSINSQLTKIFDKHEFGKILSIITVAQCLVPLISSPLFGLIYKATLETFEGMYLLTVVAILPFIIGSNLYIQCKASAKEYEKLLSTEEEKEKDNGPRIKG